MLKIKKIISIKKSEFIQNYRGQPIYNLLTGIYDLFSSVSWRNSAEANKSVRRIKNLKNKYLGKRCFIIGNGPSLNKTDLSLLKSEYTFGLNRIYLLFDKLGFNTNFLVAVNKLVIEQCAADIKKVNAIKFFSWKGKKFVKLDKNTIFIRSLARQLFSTNPENGLWEGTTVTYVALQIAYYLGFKKVIFVGVDHQFQSKGFPHEEILSQGDDKNHFSPDYFGEGLKWNFPDLKTAEYAYKIAKINYEKDGREIVDATIGGKLKIFRKVNYQKLF
jgi:hypothetical protein